MRVRLHNVKTDEIETAYFPLEKPDVFPFDKWVIVDLVRPDYPT